MERKGAGQRRLLSGALGEGCAAIGVGGLGIPNLEVMAWALQLRWQWHKKTRADRPWADLELPSHPNGLFLQQQSRQ